MYHMYQNRMAYIRKPTYSGHLVLYGLIGYDALIAPCRDVQSPADAEIFSGRRRKSTKRRPVRRIATDVLWFARTEVRAATEGCVRLERRPVRRIATYVVVCKN